jgi:hypothetical protein
VEEATNRGRTEAKYFCASGLDSPNQIESVTQIPVYAHAVCGDFELSNQASRGKMIS